MFANNLPQKLKSSLRILIEGVLIAIGAIIIVVILIPYGAAGLAIWTWDRLALAWADSE